MLKPFLIFILLVSAYCVKCDEQLSEDVLDDSVKEENVVSYFFFFKILFSFYFFLNILMVNSGVEIVMGLWKSNFRVVVINIFLRIFILQIVWIHLCDRQYSIYQALESFN